MAPQIIQGDIRKIDPDAFRSTLKTHGIDRIDTAARYMNGESEKILGRGKFSHDFLIDTKIWLGDSGAKGTLTPELIEKSLSHSLEVLGTDKVNVLYAHSPDYDTPLVDQAKAMDQQYQKGRFTHLGVSNFSPKMLQEWLDIAAKEGYVKPTYYEGQYNLLCRGYEAELFPLLRKHNIRFTGYSPLAGGFLIGNWSPDKIKEGSRFNMDQIIFRKWYGHDSMFKAVDEVKKISGETGIGMDELSLRWALNHSALSDDDFIISGGSNAEQIGSAIVKARKGPLDAEVARRLSNLWEDVKAEGAAIVVYGA